ncbi:MAG TPA: hypothetical protein VHY08_10725 [Bacillota bacterium]|nr:hypothetical protein [Bacillota bacterium]
MSEIVDTLKINPGPGPGVSSPLERSEPKVLPLAKWARLLEIIIPIYMLGKSWGIASEETLPLFKAQFPAFLIQATEFLKQMFPASSIYVQRLVATTSGALIALAVVLVFALINHHILGDRRFVDSLRFTSVSLIPIALLNGTLSHGLQTLMENVHQSVESLKASAVYSSWGYLALNLFFYLMAIWMLGGRTGIIPKKRVRLLWAGIGLVVLYLLAGLMIIPGEWEQLLPQLKL